MSIRVEAFSFYDCMNISRIIFDQNTLLIYDAFPNIRACIYYQGASPVTHDNTCANIKRIKFAVFVTNQYNAELLCNERPSLADKTECPLYIPFKYRGRFQISCDQNIATNKHRRYSLYFLFVIGPADSN